MYSSYEFIVRIDGQPYELMTGFSFSRDMKLMASAFELSLVDPDRNLLAAFRPGKLAEIEVDGVVLAKAYLGAVQVEDSHGHVFKYSGRDHTGDLVDCSASFSNGGFEKKNISLSAAVKDVLKPFKMDLKIAGEVGANFKKCSINPGETVFNFIDRLCRYRAMLPLADGMGGLVLTKAGSISSGGALVVGKDGNVKTRQGMIDHRSRYSQITVMGSGDHSDLLEADAETLSGAKGIAYDPDITRHRPLIIQAESEGFDLDLQERAEWEVRHRRFIGTEMVYTVPGWEASKGTLWKINTSVPVKDPEMNISRTMLIKSVSLSRSEKGTVSEIGVAPAEIYDLPAIKEPNSDDGIWGGGL